MAEKINVIVLVNNLAMYKQMVVGSLPKKHFELMPIVDSNHPTKNLNALVKSCKGWVMVCHQDVSFPPNFYNSFFEQIKGLKNIGVIGSFGRDLALKCAGNIYNPYPNKRNVGTLPCKALNVDEHCFLFHTNTGLLFDETLQYYHMYASDLCMASIGRGLTNYIISTGVNHLSPRGLDDSNYMLAVDWFYNKWVGKTKIKQFINMSCEVNFETGRRVSYL